MQNIKEQSFFNDFKKLEYKQADLFVKKQLELVKLGAKFDKNTNKNLLSKVFEIGIRAI